MAELPWLIVIVFVAHTGELGDEYMRQSFEMPSYEICQEGLDTLYIAENKTAFGFCIENPA